MGIAAAGFLGWLHYITIGPNRTDEDQHKVLTQEGELLESEEEA